MTRNIVSEASARRAARRVGLSVRRSRRALSGDNRGGLMLVDPQRNWVVGGERFDLTPEAIVAFCKPKPDKPS
jgi:hypothetical protein